MLMSVASDGEIFAGIAALYMSRKMQIHRSRILFSTKEARVHYLVTVDCFQESDFTSVGGLVTISIYKRSSE